MNALLANTATTGTLVFFSFYYASVAYGLLRKKRYKFLHRRMSVKKIKKLSWEDFEYLCAEYFQSQGWKTQNNEKLGADGGIDIFMTKKRKSAIVQCKRYGDALVTVKVVREMYGLMHDREVDKVFIVTSNRFTKECFSFINGKNIELIDGETLRKLIY